MPRLCCVVNSDILRYRGGQKCANASIRVHTRRRRDEPTALAAKVLASDVNKAVACDGVARGRHATDESCADAATGEDAFEVFDTDVALCACGAAWVAARVAAGCVELGAFGVKEGAEALLAWLRYRVADGAPCVWGGYGTCASW